MKAGTTSYSPPLFNNKFFLLQQFLFLPPFSQLPHYQRFKNLYYWWVLSRTLHLKRWWKDQSLPFSFSVFFFFYISLEFIHICGVNEWKQKQEKEVLGVSFRPENFIPGLIIGFIFGFFLDLTKLAKNPSGRKIGSSPTKHQPRIVSSNSDEELKMVIYLFFIGKKKSFF